MTATPADPHLRVSGTGDPSHAKPATGASPSVVATFCATLVDEWIRAGVTDAVVAPGSRSTPMAVALAADERMRVHVHHDERAAGFVALGLGLASGRPALVLTTSGTAAVELHPAIVEAHHAKVPMLVLTADRPPELRDVGAPQTIDQNHLYGRAVRWYVDPGVPDLAMRDQWRSIAARAHLETIGRPCGPVHVNLPFREPLLGAPDGLPAGRPGGGPWHGVPGPQGDIADVDAGALADAVRGRRGVIVAGAGIEQPEAVHALAAALRWPVLADPRSGCRLPLPATVSHFDDILRSPDRAPGLRPEMVVRLGALPASKVLGQWLTSIDAWQVAVETDGVLFDPDRVLASILTAEPGAFCARLLTELELSDGTAAERVSPDGWYEAWTVADADAASAIREVLANHPEPTEPAIARDVVGALPSGAHLVVSSSMPIRDVEWYAAPRAGLTVHANRGANGIDGVVSTGVGVALATGAPTAVLIGDVAFLHDSNALLSLGDRPVDLVVVVVDNDGGGIFSFLPQAMALPNERFELLFGTPHGVDLAALVGAHGIPVTTVERQAGLANAVGAAAATGGPQVIIIRTDRADNVALHDELHQAVAAALAE